MQSLTKVYLTAFVIVVLVIGAAFTIYKPASTTEDINLKTFASEQELKDFLQTNAESYQDYEYRSSAVRTQEELVPSAGGSAKSEPTSAGSQSSLDYSKTNIQVKGVDEADFVKNDGKYIYIVSNNRLLIVDAYPAENAQILSNTTIENPQEIFVVGDNLIVFSSPNYVQPLIKETKVGAPDYYPRYEQKVKIQIYDISDRSNPVVKKEFTVDGDYFDSRMIDNKVYAIINSYASYDYRKEAIVLPKFAPEGYGRQFPQIYYPDVPSSSYTFTNVIKFDTEGSFDNKVFLFGSANVIYVSKDNIYVTYEKYVPYYETQITIIDKVILPLLPADVADRIRMQGTVAANPQNAFQAQEKEFNNYLQTLSSEEQQKLYDKLQERMQEVQAEITKDQQKTIVHKISIKDGIRYESSGEFPGHLLNQFSMDEYNGNLRVATTVGNNFLGGPRLLTAQAAEYGVTTAVAKPGAIEPNAKENAAGKTEPSVAPPELIGPPVIVPPAQRSNSVNNVYVLDESLNVIGKLEDLAKGERIFSARFIGDRLYLVTFVKVDPLFVIDLSVPQQPRVLGELKIPGVSQYLHPYDEGGTDAFGVQTRFIIGIGQDAKDAQGRTVFSGVKVSLFDVSDVSAPKEVDNYIIGKEGTYTPITYEHKSFLFDKEKNVMVIPVTINDYTDFKYQSWSGAYVFSFTPENKISLTGTVAHDDRLVDPTISYMPYFYNPAVERSLYMDNVLYTISQAKIKMNSLTDLSEVNEINLPEPEYDYGVVKGGSGGSGEIDGIGAPTTIEGIASVEVSIP